MKIQNIYNYINEIAPFSLAESWDNVGMLIGGLETEVSKVIVALDCTEDVINEAKEMGANLIITHHPVIFHPIKSIDNKSLVYKLIANGIGVISAHTNLDIAYGGVNDILAEKLELEKIEGMGPMVKTPFNKIVVFVPKDSAEKVAKSMHDEGAGLFGTYKDCMFTSQGIGSFTPKQGSNPTIGRIEEKEQVEEVRIEMICSPNLTENVIKALKQSHPYELPAVDIFENHSIKSVDSMGLGRIGNLKNPMKSVDFARFVKERLGCETVSFTDIGEQIITRVAVCGGAGGGLVDKAKSMGAQAFVTGDIRHDVWLSSKDNHICLVDGGHYHTEKIVIENLVSRLVLQFDNIEIIESKTEKSPVRVV